MQKTDLNVAPYYDDFDPNDKFHRVLFRPGFAVQARELTTLQSILQNQVEKHGRHFFKEGSMVIPGQISFDIRYYAVKLQSNHSGNPISGYLADYVNGIITGGTSGVTARVVGFSDATTTDEPTLYVKYISTATQTASASGSVGASTAGLTNRFVNGESISVDKAISSGSIASGNLSATLLTSNATANGSSAAIEEGVYFIRGQFVKVDAQRIILDKYNNTPSYRIGLTISETLITPEGDTTLLDNAAGSTNVNAKGAHRLKLDLTLSKLPLGSADDEEFVELMRVKNGSVQKIVDRTDYNVFQENIARRTFDESGNYTVRPYGIEIKETLDDGSNNGVYASNQITDAGKTAAENSLTVQVSPGKAYVRGYEIEQVVPSFIDLPKPRTTDNFDSAITNVEVGNFTRVTNVKGSPDLSPFISGDVAEPYREIQLHSVQKTNYTTAANAQIGVARARAFEHSSGNTSNDTLTNAADNDSEFNLYLFDIRMFTQIQLSANFSGAPSVAQGSKITGQTSGATGFIHAAVNNLVQLITVSGNFNVGEKLISSGQTVSNNANQLLEDGSNNDLTVAAITSRNFDDVKSVFMNSPNTGQDFTANLVLSSTLTLGGNVSMNGSNANVTGFNTTFTTDLKEGDFVTVPGAGSGGADLTARVNTITNNTAIVLASNSATAVTSVQAIRLRNQLRDQEKNLLIRKLRKDTIKTLKTDVNAGVSQTVQTFRQTFVVTTTAAGEINLTAGSNETFSAKSNTDCVVTVITAGSAIGGSSNTAAAGDIVNLDASTTPAQTYVVNGNQLTITNPEILGNGAKVKVIATLTRTVASEKTKTKNAAHLVLVDADASAGAEYGTASQHKDISLGRADVFKLYAVLDSEDTSTTPLLPQFTVTGVSGTFQRGETIQGASSGANAVIINTTNPITFIITNGKSLIANETITGVTSTTTATLGTFTAGSKDITSRFTLDTGQRDNFYDISRLVRKGGKPVPVGKLLIVCDFFAHGTGDFFSVDSYSAIDYKEIPTYTATRVDPEVKAPSGLFDLRDSVDFRPRVKDATIDTTTTSQSQTLHKVTSKSFDFSSRSFAGTGASEILIPKDNSQFQYDFDFFLGRVDMLFLTEQGMFKVVEGEPAEQPFPSKRIEKAMLLATIQLPPYVLDIDDVSFEKTDNRRFTMRDIGSIERRLNQVEYYTALNLLEKDAQSFQVQDENGLDRFKSGFVVDNFSGHSVGDVQNADYRNAIDYEDNELRPKFTMKGVGLIEENTTDTQRTADSYRKTGDLITLPYTDVVSVQQPYATRVENLNPVLSFAWTGICTLDPSGDEWFEVNRLPALIINRDGNFDQLVAQVGNAMGTIWNSWQTQWTGTSTSEQVTNTGATFTEGNSQFRNVTTRVTTTTTRRQRRTGVNTRVVAQIDRESLGDRLRSTALIPFMRSKNVNFVVDGLKPNTRVYPFFDKVDVTNFVTPATGGVGTVTSTGGAIFSNGGGSCTGLFTIPDPNVAGNPQFQTGERLFRLTSSSTNATNPEPETFAQALFSSTGILRNIQEEILATRNGRIEVNNVNDTRTISSETSTNRVDREFVGTVQNEDDDEENNLAIGGGGGGGGFSFADFFGGWFDPLAQTIISSETGGEFITKIDVFFQRKDPDIPVLCQLREVVNGFPTRKQLPFAQKWLQPYMEGTVSMSNGSTTVAGTNTNFLTGRHNLKVGDTITIEGAGNSTSGVTNDTGNYDAAALVAKVTAIASDTSLTVDTASARAVSSKKISNVNLSSTATSPTTFRFDSPVYLQDGQEVAIVLISPCERYFAWISRMGEQEIGTTRMISKQPHLGVLFKSQNNSTWTPYDYEDLKFTVHRASFETDTRGTLTLTNDVVETKTLGVDPIRTIEGSSFVQVTHPDHHMYSSSNNVTISGVSSGITTTLSSAISSTTQTSIQITANADFVASNDGSNIYIQIGSERIRGTISSNTITATTRGYDSTTAATHSNGATVELYQLNGIPLDQVNKTHTALTNIGIDSYTLATATAPSSNTGDQNQGGSAVVVTENAMMDGMQTLVPTMLYPETGISSTIRTTTATSPDGTETSFSLAGTSFAKPITLGENFIFDKPRMVCSQINETNEIAGQKSFFLDLELRSSRENLSPIVDLDRKSIVAFTNRLNQINSASDMGVTALQGDFVSSEQPQGDNNEAIYITRRVALDNPATGLKVFIDMNRFASANVKVMFKILRSDDASDFDEIGYNFFNTDGEPDTVVNASLSATDFKEYEYTANNLDEFIAFSIKVVMQGTNTSEPPRLKDLRALALAT